MNWSAKVAELNIDENLFTKEKYGIDRYPTLLIFRDGEEVARMIGSQTKDSLLKMFFYSQVTYNE